MPEIFHLLSSDLSFPQESPSSNYHYEFGPFRLATDTRKLFKNGEAIRLTPKVFEVLLAMVKRQGKLVTKEELFRLVWSDSIVEDGNISVAISTLRKILGDNPQNPYYIETVQGYGYIFIAKVEIEPILSKASIFQYNDNQRRELKAGHFDYNSALAIDEYSQSIKTTFSGDDAEMRKFGGKLFDRRISLTLIAALIFILIAFTYTTLPPQSFVFIGVVSMLSALIGWLWGRTI